VSTAESPGPIRRQVVYSGRVQGVCFRATSADLSRGFKVVGYVRNLPDGTVELEAEGPPAEVEGFLAAVSRHFRGLITREQLSTAVPLRNETDFDIRY
jgi:acylphosphatase